MVTFRTAKASVLTTLQSNAATLEVSSDAIVYGGGRPPAITPYIEVQCLPASVEDIAIDGSPSRRTATMLISACPEPELDINTAQNECIELLERVEDVLYDNVQWLDPEYNLYDGIEADSGRYRATLQYTFEYQSSTEVS